MSPKHVLVTAAFFVSAFAQAHAKIEASQPKANAELAAAPAEIRLQFNEALEPAFSKIELVDAQQTMLPIPKIALDPADAKVMFTPIPRLPAGQYEVRWTAMTHDGHKVKGRYTFSVK